MSALLRRPLTLLFLSTCAVLAFVIVWAVLGFSGPARTLDRARAEFEQGDYGACVRTLDLAESTIPPPEAGGDAILEMLLDLRRRAHDRLSNPRLAVADLERLIALRSARGVTEDELLPLRHELIRQRIQTDDFEKARAEASALSAAEPDDGRAAELLGEAIEAETRDELARAIERVERVVPERDREAVLGPLRRWLYGAEDAPQTELAWRDYQRALTRTVFAPALLAGLDDDLARLRSSVTAARRSFRRALALGGTPVAAYLGEARALRAQGRNRDLELLAHAYVWAFDHVFTIEAVIDQVELQLELARPLAALAAADRFLPPGTWRERHAAGRLDRRVGRLLRLTAEAARRAGMFERLDAIAAEAAEIEASGLIEIGDNLSWILATAAHEESERRTRDEHYRTIWDRRMALPASPARDEALLEIMEVRGPLVAELGNDWVLRSWARLAPDDPTMLRERIDYHRKRNEVAAALSHVRQLQSALPRDEPLLLIYAELRDAQLGDNQNSRNLLTRCLTLGRALPDSYPDPAILIPLAERALALGERPALKIAAACAREAGRIFPWAIRPKQIEVRALLALEENDAALRLAESVHGTHADHRAALELLLETRDALDRPVDDLVHEMMLARMPAPAVATALLQGAEVTSDLETGVAVARAAARKGYQEPRLAEHIADVMVRVGDAPTAAAMLQLLVMSARNNDDLAGIGLKWYWVQADAAPSAQRPAALATGLPLVLSAIAPSLDRHVELAAGLLDRGFPGLARAAIAPVLEAPRFTDERSGVHYALLARIEIGLKNLVAARQALLRAMTFEDGRHAARTLALMLWSDGAASEAGDAWFEESVDDLTAAALTARFGKGPGARRAVEAWAARRRAEDPNDVTPTLLLDTLRPLSSATIADTPERRDQLLFALASRDEAEFLPAALEAIRGLQVDRATPDPRLACFEASCLLAADRTKEAVPVLQSALRDAPAFAPAFELLAAAFTRPFGDLDAAHARKVIDGLGSFTALAGPRLQALVLEARWFLAEQGSRERSEHLERLAALWLEYPEPTGVDATHVARLLDEGLPDRACRLADRLLERMPVVARATSGASDAQDADATSDERQELQQLWYRSARARIDAASDDRKRRTAESALVARANQDFDSPTPPLLAALALADFEAGRPREKLLALFSAAENLIEGTPRGRPLMKRLAAEIDAFDAVVRRVAASGEVERARQLLTRALAAAPGLVDLWHLRADLESRYGTPADVLASLAWSVDLLPGSYELDRYVIAAIRAGSADPSLDGAIESLGPMPLAATMNDVRRRVARYLSHALANHRGGRDQSAFELFAAATTSGPPADEAGYPEVEVGLEFVISAFACGRPDAGAICARALRGLAQIDAVPDRDFCLRVAKMLELARPAAKPD